MHKRVEIKIIYSLHIFFVFENVGCCPKLWPIEFFFNMGEWELVDSASANSTKGQQS